MDSKFRDPTELSLEARDLISKLIVTNPEKRLSLKNIKKHQFFNPRVPGGVPMDWKVVSEGKLKMPHIIQRQIIKSKLPFAFESDEEDDEYGGYHEHS